MAFTSQTKLQVAGRIRIWKDVIRVTELASVRLVFRQDSLRA